MASIMASIISFGRYLPERVLGNGELAARIGREPGWIFEMSGIEERRIAEAGETVVTMAARAARNCLRGGEEVGLIMVASGSSERRFPARPRRSQQRSGCPACRQ